MLRSIIGVFVGILAGGMVVFLIELPGMLMYPLPPNFDLQDKQAVASHLASIPVVFMAVVVVAWAVGPLVASLVACCIVRRAHLAHALVIAFIFTLLDLMNLVQIPSPWWMWAGGLAAPIITAILGARLAERLCPPGGPGPQPYDMREKGMAC